MKKHNSRTWKILSVFLITVMLSTNIIPCGNMMFVNAVEENYISEETVVETETDTTEVEFTETESEPEEAESEPGEEGSEAEDPTTAEETDPVETTEESTDESCAEETTEATIEEVLTEEFSTEETSTEWDSVIEEIKQITPNIVVNESFDTYLSFTLSVPEDVELPQIGQFFYEVKVTTHKGEDEAPIVETYTFKKKDTPSQDETIQMHNGLVSEGEEWTYDIEVSLVLKEAKEAVCISEAIQLNDVPVVPYYETKLTLKKGTTTLYTTQSHVAIATVKFSKKTTEKDQIKVEDISYSGAEALTFEAVGNDLIVYAEAGGDTALGKHTVKVTASAPEYTYASSANITINVVQGIEPDMLSVVTPADKLYKADKKAASLTFKAQYEKDNDTLKYPYKKKVTWQVVSEIGRTIEEGDPLYGKISIKNGVVTVKKDFQLSENPRDNRFKVRAIPADFAYNMAIAESEVVEIVGHTEDFGEVVIVKLDNSGNYVVTARSESTVVSKQLGYVILFKAGAPVKDSYTEAEIETWTYEPQYLTYKTNNSAVKIEKDGLIRATKPVKNVKITVKANDKSNRKAELKKLTVAYEQPALLGLKIEQDLGNGVYMSSGRIHSAEDIIEMTGDADTRYRVTVMQKEDVDSEWQPLSSYVNYSLSVQNAKVMSKSGFVNQVYMINTTKESFTIKLTDKALKTKTTFTVLNTAYPKGNAPKVSTKDKLKALSYDGEQTITYELKKNGKFEYDNTGKVVYISVNLADKYKSAKNEANYKAFEKVVSGLGYHSVDAGTITLNAVTSDANPLPAGSYKLWFTFGTMDEYDRFQADTKAVSVTLKANKVQTSKGKYTPTSSYKMSIKEGGTVELTGKGSRFLKETVVFSNLKNANVNGSSNGFRDYFELKGNVLCIKESLSQEQLDYISSKDGKNSCIGYVDYSVYLSNTNGSYSETKGTAKITITMQDTVRKFTFSTAKAPNDKTAVSVYAYAAGKKINLLHAYATSGSYTASYAGDSRVVLTPKTDSSKPKGGTNSVTIYVVPEGTFGPYKTKLDALKSAWDNATDANKETAKATYLEALKKYGIKVTAKVTLPTRIIENREQSEAVIKIVNQERAKHGLRPVSQNENVMYASFIRAKEIERYFAHTRPDGRSCFTVLNENGITYRGAGENIAMGYCCPDCVMKAWMNSPGHRANILNGSFTEMGVGCYEKDGYLYWVQLFIY